jgi:hypothetical protein
MEIDGTVELFFSITFKEYHALLGILSLNSDAVWEAKMQVECSGCKEFHADFTADGRRIDTCSKCRSKRSRRNSYPKRRSGRLSDRR